MKEYHLDYFMDRVKCTSSDSAKKKITKTVFIFVIQTVVSLVGIQPG